MTEYVVDTSALIAIILGEKTTLRLLTACDRADALYLSAGSLLETRIVLHRKKGRVSRTEVDALIDALNITIVPVSEAQANLAADAYARFGKGQGHPAQLNFGDCFSYALAKERDAPLLFVGDDFSQTDLELALG